MIDPRYETLQLLAGDLDGELHFGSMMRALYSTDASAYQETPLAVAIPKCDSDIQKIILAARKIGVGVIPRTAGTSLAGQVVGAGIVVDVSRHFTRILGINEGEKTVRVQPGVIRDELNQALAERGLMFGPETSTSNRAMIGGMVGNNSCGSNSVVYGSTRDHVLELTGFLSDGSKASFYALSREQFAAKCEPKNDSLESKIYRSVRDLLRPEGVRKEIHDQFPLPEIARRNTGYAIDLLTDCQEFESDSRAPFDFCKLLAGSEGTLFFTTEIKLKCLTLPPPVSALQCAHFESVDAALRATLIALEYQPYAVELMDHFIIEGALRNREQQSNAGFVEGAPAAILVTEIRGQTESDVRNTLDELEKKLKAASLGYAYPIISGDETRNVWELRKAGLGIIANVPGDEKPCPVIEDTAVAVRDLPEFIAEFNQLLEQQFGLQCVHYAHAGSGEIHLRPILNLKTEQGNQQFRQVAVAIADLVKKYRGSLSGEHGDGRLRGEFLERMIGPRNFEVIRKIKQIWDPDNVLNPHKIIDTPPMNEGLRYVPGQLTPDFPTVMDFSQEQGILRAAELCSGSGDCRKTHFTGGTMCPSYMVTRNEADSTRGRANMLRHVLTAAPAEVNPLDNDDLLQVMDLCLSCKGCKRECPSNVDVGKLKAEVLQTHYDVHGVPRSVRAIASFASTMALAAKMPRFYNFFSSSRIVSSSIKRWLGFSPHRTLPKLSPTTLRSWFAQHNVSPQAGRHGEVVLFCDEFTNFVDVEIGIAAVELLERLGWRVVLADNVESGRAAISKGLLRQAKTCAEENVRRLAPLVSAEKLLIGIEPSAILSFRDEYPLLVGAELRQQAEAVSKHTWMLNEFIARQMSEGKIDHSSFVQKQQVIRLHGHCHQKALASLKPTVQMLQLPKGHRVRLIPSGCCGMAGSFGFEREHYDISMQIGELVLFPAIRAESENALIAAPGTSCRHQILDGTGRTALHPAQILRDALLR